MTPAPWLDRVRDVPVLDLAERLGLAVRGVALGPCPACQAERRSRADGRPPVGVTGDGRGWRCHACDAKGDALDLVARARLGERPPPGDRDRWAALRAECAALRLCEPAAEAGPRPPVTRARPRPAALAILPSREGRVPRDKHATEARRPHPAELAALWAACRPVTADAEVAAWLAGRGLDASTVVALDLARALPPGARCPRWASWTERDAEGRPVRRWTWPEGWRCLVALYDPAAAPAWTGEGDDRAAALPVAGLVARAVTAEARERRKELLPVGGLRPGLVYACPVARAVLVADVLAEAPVLVAEAWACEGTPDWLAAVLATARAGRGDRTMAPRAVLAGTPGVTGSWEGLARALAGPSLARAPVYLATHADEAGDGYAARLRPLLPGRDVRRLRLPARRDLADVLAPEVPRVQPAP